MVYAKIPPFPPVGSVNKVFYIAAFGTVLGAVVDLFGWRRAGGWLALVQPALAVLYIGWPRIPEGLLELSVGALLGGLLQLCLTERPADSGPGRGDDVDKAALLACACLGFAPVALFGASSTSFQLCLTAAVAIGAIVIWHLRRPRYSFGAASLLGGVGGFLAVAYTVVLITQKASLPAVFALATIVLAPRASAAVNARLNSKFEIIRRAVFVVCCLVPAGAGAALALVFRPSALPT